MEEKKEAAPPVETEKPFSVAGIGLDLKALGLMTGFDFSGVDQTEKTSNSLRSYVPSSESFGFIKSVKALKGLRVSRPAAGVLGRLISRKHAKDYFRMSARREQQVGGPFFGYGFLFGVFVFCNSPRGLL